MLSKQFSKMRAAELKQLQKLNTPVKIQNFLDSLRMNFSDEDPCFSVSQVLEKKTAHCFEGALLAAAALWYHGRKPLLLDLTVARGSGDEDHVIALFQEKIVTKNGTQIFWGAISKTNHAVLRYREPVYKTVRELVMSYFHEYFLNSGQKTLRSYSRPFDLSKYGANDLKSNWLISQAGIMDIIQDLADSPHEEILNAKQTKNLRLADEVEVLAGKIKEWNKSKTKKQR